ncbi:hypothetical protein NJI34_28990 [Pseudomonas sp. S 311-6]|nr:hypothetical protein [Pseudomonas sp. S 311-6]
MPYDARAKFLFRRQSMSSFDLQKVIRSSLICGVVAALCWTVADMLLVGFVPRPQAYPLFSQQLAGQLDSEMAILMLDGSPQRLMWGIYLATFSVVLYMLACFALYRLLPPGNLSRLTVLLLLAGYAWSPLGHAAFGFVGLQAQSMLHGAAGAWAAQVQAFNQFQHLLTVHWIGSVAASALGWLLVMGRVMTGRTRLPRWTAIFNPVVVAIVLAAVTLQFPGNPLAALIGSASLNLAQLVFFGSALLLVSGDRPRA